MATPSVYRLGLARFARSPALGAVAEVPKVTKHEDQPSAPPPAEAKSDFTQFADPEQKRPLQVHLRKTLSIHIGADLLIPVESNVWTPPKVETQHVNSKPQQLYDPFEGLPLRDFADKLGESFAPVAKQIREEQRARNKGLADVNIQNMAVPSVPHFLPFTRWAAKSERIRETFVIEDEKTRRKARLSWYHPGDTMVPRGWFKDGLLADLAYCKPFSGKK